MSIVRKQKFLPSLQTDTVIPERVRRKVEHEGGWHDIDIEEKTKTIPFSPSMGPPPCGCAVDS